MKTIFVMLSVLVTVSLQGCLYLTNGVRRQMGQKAIYVLTTEPDQNTRAFATNTKLSDVEKVIIDCRQGGVQNLEITDKATIKGLVDALKLATITSAGGVQATNLGDNIEFYLMPQKGKPGEVVKFHFNTNEPEKCLGVSFQLRLKELFKREEKKREAREKVKTHSH